MAPSTRSRNKLKQTTLTTIVPVVGKRSPPRRRARSREFKKFQSDDGSSGLDDVRMQPPSSPVKSSPKVVGSPTLSTRKKRRIQVVESDEQSESDDADLRQAGLPPTSNLVPPLKSNSPSGATSDDESPPPRRVLTRGKRLRSSPVSESSEEDLADEVDENRIMEARFRERDRKTVFQKNLEKLKRRKQGGSNDNSTNSDGENDDNEEEENFHPFRGAKPMLDDTDEEERHDADSDHSSDFIVEDGDIAPIELPPEFSMNSHQDLAVQFKTIFQFFVHIAVQEAPERHDFMAQCMREQSYFATPLRTMRKKLSGIRDSLVASSVWRSSFRKALENYPVFDLLDLQSAVPSCDACQLGGRMSTRLGRLGGSPYDKCGFTTEDSDDEEEQEEEDTVEFHLGRFCAQRTRVFHEFTHWEHTLFKSIEEEVEQLRVRQEAMYIRTAGGLTAPEDLTDADAVCDWLDRRKVIDIEWSRIKDMMDRGGSLDAVMKKGSFEDD